LGKDIVLCVYRIAQEALRNAVRHSQATTTIVRLEARANEIVLHVIDDGLGFDPALANGLDGLGLVSMRERARQVGGDVTVTAKPGQGTRVQARIPIASASFGGCALRNTRSTRPACHPDPNLSVVQGS